MGALRERMEREMVLRRMSLRTRQSYTEAVAALRRYPQMDHPQIWLFPAVRTPDPPLSTHAAQKIYYLARDRARRMTRGRRGLLHLHRKRLSLSTPCRFVRRILRTRGTVRPREWSDE